MPSFKLNSSDSEFENRIDSVFGSLDSISNNLRENSSFVNNPLKRGRSEESDSFKVPCLPRKSRKHLPGYITNPNKWEKYSLKDTPCLGDSENKKAGLELMAQLRQRAASTSNDDPTSSDLIESGKIVFKKPALDKTKDDAAPKPKNLGERCFVMEEYEFGKKKKLKSKNIEADPKKASKKSSQISLSHLDFDDGEDDE